jgi:hypothetical protein
LIPAIAVVLAFAGCGRVDYDVADLQLDVAAPLPDAAETLHVCVTGAGELSQGAGNGRAAFTGLPAGEPAEVRLEVYDEDGAMLAAAGPVTLDADTPWCTTPLEDPGEACADDGHPAPEGSDTWLLALRFQEDGP